ncbi:MAG: SGNH/GDSL hydrolase family protein [Candidatus Lernaella stagnicola]|nr:SGNH/GDSL hydrolase family protein [Candidatus Lernaella stagnicola]
MSAPSTMSSKRAKLRRRRWLRRILFFALGLALGIEVFGYVLRHTTLSVFDFFKLEWPRRAYTQHDSLKILALGDSFTYGITSGRESEFLIGYPEILGNLLHSETATVEVINLAYPAADSGRMRERLQKFLKTPASYPDVVLIATGINNIGFAKFVECQRAYGDRPPSLSTRAAGYLYRHSVMFRILALTSGSLLRIRLPGVSVDEYVYPDSDGVIHWVHPPAKRWTKECLADDVRSIVAQTTKTGAVPVFVTYHQESFATESAREFAVATGAPLVDVAEAAQQIDPDLLARYRASGSWHPNFCGYVAVAALIAPVVEALPAAQEKGFRMRTYDEVRPFLYDELAKDKKTDRPCPAVVGLFPTTAALP